MTNNSRLTARTAGKYLIVGIVGVARNTTNYQIMLEMFLGRSRINQNAPVDNHTLSITSIYPLAVGDYVELRLYQDSGASRDLLIEANAGPDFMMQLIAP